MSSGFKENFERGERDSLDYDDSAFYYFSLTLGLVFLLPATWYVLLKPIFRGDFSIAYTFKNCPCKLCTEKLNDRASKYRWTWINKWFFFNVALLAIAWYFLIQNMIIVSNLENLKTFIPHDILSVEPDATVQQVKKAYRKLSREKHPDKNPDNPDAVNDFIQITKAYTVSTFLYQLIVPFCRL
jgi:translocation protein SEC63